MAPAFALPLEEGEAKRQFFEFFSEVMHSRVLDLAQSYPDKRSLKIDFTELSKFNPDLADAVVDFPDIYIKAAEEAAKELDVPVVGNSKFEPHVRIYCLPEESIITIQNIGAEHLNKLTRLDGVVTLITQIMPKIATARYVCVHCARTVDIPVGKLVINKPSICPGCGRGDGLTLAEDMSGFTNMQRSQMQDPVEKIRGNVAAPQIDLWLEDDAVNSVSPGDNVTVTGILRWRQNQNAKVKTPVYSKFFDVVSIDKMQKEFEELTITKEEEAEIVEISKDPQLYDKIIMSIAPSIYGYSEMKEAIALQLFGGTQAKVLPDGKKIRGDLHVLLVGDPGTAKSTILKYVQELAPKAIYVSGRGASGVGLTASAEKDEIADGGWVLKAGALVLASGGMVMVDEFDKMEPNDRASMHEAMEQQSYHPNTKILLANGKESKIGNLVDTLVSKNKQDVIKGKDCEILPLKKNKIKIITSDFKTIFKSSADRVSRHVAPSTFVKITLQTGREIFVTPEHPCWVKSGEKIQVKPASKLTIEDIQPFPENPENPLGGKIIWKTVKSVESIPNKGIEWVYDIGVEPTHSFVSECMILHNSISVAKAGIVTTFKAKTSILAAANPKLGRFDPNTPPAQQFDIPPTLMSRFDLIFAIKDVLDEAKDRRLVEHVLLGHMYAAKKTAVKDMANSSIVPPIFPEKLRKYIAYARKYCNPILTDEAANRIKEYYLMLRKMGAQQNTYPVTAREIEGLIRLSEASAKVRLSDSVELRDAERAIALVHYVLSDIFLDKETGRIDSDIINTGQPKSKVDKLRALLGIINALEQKYDQVDIDDIVHEAATIGLDENYARRLIDELKRQGDLYEPKVGFVKSSRKERA